MFSTRLHLVRPLPRRVALSCLTIIFCIASSLHADEPTGDEWLTLFKAHAEQVKSIEADFELQLQGNKNDDVHIHLRREFDSPRFWGTVVRSAGKSDEQMVWTYVRNEEQRWLARPETGADTVHAPGTWRVDLGTTGKPPIPEAIVMPWFYPEHLRAPFVPFHIRVGLATEESGVEMTFREARAAKKEGEYVVVIDFSKQGHPPMTLEYEVSIADGFKILSLAGFSEVDGKRVKGIEQKAGDFKKVDDVWCPMVFEERLLDMGTRRWVRWTLRIRQLRINPQFEASDFVYQPPFGSQVFGPMGLPHRVGNENPHAPSGQDQNDSRVLDARQKATQQQSSSTSQPVDDSGK